jgi:hypothetical protein
MNDVVNASETRHADFFHINEESFLPASRDAFLDVFAQAICRKVFEASGLVPLNAQVMLDRLEARLRTPPVQAIRITLNRNHLQRLVAASLSL